MKKIIKWVVLVLVLLVLIGGGFIWATKDKPKDSTSSSSQEETSQTTDKNSTKNQSSKDSDQSTPSNKEKDNQASSGKDGMVEPSADPQTEPMIEPSADPQTEPMIEPSADPQTNPHEKNQWADTSTSIADKDNPLLNNNTVENQELNDAANQATSPEVEANTDTKAKFQPSDWDYYEEGNYLILTRYKGKGEVPKLPKEYKGKQIDQSVLYNN